MSTARRAHVTPPSRAHAPRTERLSGFVSRVPRRPLPRVLCPAACAVLLPRQSLESPSRVLSIGGHGAAPGSRSWTFSFLGTPTPPAGLSLVAVDSETGRKVKSLLQSLPGPSSLLSLLLPVTTKNQVASAWYAG